MGDIDKLEDIVGIIEGGMDLIDENSDKIERILGRSGEVNIGEGEPLKEVLKTEEHVRIITETDGDYDSVSLIKENGKVIIQLDDKELVANVPEDSVLEGVEASLNNGVLEVTIPRK